MIDIQEITFKSNQTFVKTDRTSGTFYPTMSKCYPSPDDFLNTYGDFNSTIEAYHPVQDTFFHSSISR